MLEATYNFKIKIIPAVANFYAEESAINNMLQVLELQKIKALRRYEEERGDDRLQTSLSVKDYAKMMRDHM